MSAHSLIPPSSAAIWGSPDGCTGWVLMSQQYPDDESGEEALEGEASHEIGAELIGSATRGPTLTGPDHFVGKQAANGIIFTEEMYDGALIYANDVARVMRDRAIFGGRGFGTEKRLIMPQIHEQSFGTTDQFIYDSIKRELFIWDYKFGYIIYEAFENWQMINYIAGIIKLLELDGIDEQNITVHIRVIQPRAHHRDGIIREWVVKLSDLRGYFNILNAKAHEALGPNPILHTGSHCRFCSARHACAPALQAGVGLYEVAAKPVPLELSPLSLGVQLLIIKRAIKQLEYLESAYMERVKVTIKKGTLVPNWNMEHGRGKLAWNKPANEIIALGNLLGFDLKKPDAVKTPTQAKSLGIDDAVINAYSDKPRTGLMLVPDNGSKARKFFGDNNND